VPLSQLLYIQVVHIVKNLSNNLSLFYMKAEFLPLIIQLIFALGFVTVTMVAIHFLDKYYSNRKSARKLESFECGIPSQGNARLPFSIKYFLTAILFVLFDVEVIFFYPWAINFKQLGANGFFAMLLFMSGFVMGFLYLFKKDAFKWE
jgi:NADH-quinone oxidoreductase subunit A